VPCKTLCILNHKEPLRGSELLICYLISAFALTVLAWNRSLSNPASDYWYPYL